MSRYRARLLHLLVRLEALCERDDPDLVQLRGDIESLAVQEARFPSPLRYVGLSLFSDRAARLLRTNSQPEA